MRRPHTSRSLHTQGDPLPRLGGGLWAGAGGSVPSLRPQVLGARDVEDIQLIPHIRNYPVLWPPDQREPTSETVWSKMLPQLLRDSEQREEQVGSEPEQTLLRGQEPPGRELALCSATTLSELVSSATA